MCIADEQLKKVAAAPGNTDIYLQFLCNIKKTLFGMTLYTRQLVSSFPFVSGSCCHLIG